MSVNASSRFYQYYHSLIVTGRYVICCHIARQNTAGLTSQALVAHLLYITWTETLWASPKNSTPYHRTVSLCFYLLVFCCCVQQFFAQLGNLWEPKMFWPWDDLLPPSCSEPPSACRLILPECSRKNRPLGFFANFSETAWNFSTKFYTCCPCFHLRLICRTKFDCP